MSGYLITLNGPLHQQAKRQTITARSSAEAEIYAADESGYGIQLDFPPGFPKPDNVPTYSAACASDDGCLGQGNCKVDFYRRVFNMQ